MEFLLVMSSINRASGALASESARGVPGVFRADGVERESARKGVPERGFELEAAAVRRDHPPGREGSEVADGRGDAARRRVAEMESTHEREDARHAGLRDGFTYRVDQP